MVLQKHVIIIKMTRFFMSKKMELCQMDFAIGLGMTYIKPFKLSDLEEISLGLRSQTSLLVAVQKVDVLSSLKLKEFRIIVFFK